MKFMLVATAGHVDHGKSALIEALTGTNPDRLKEEKDREITIDIGFAHFMNDDVCIGFLDLPGHLDYMKNFLSGVYAADSVLLVTSAVESIMNQTVEHLLIAGLLRIRNLIIAITKCDSVEQGKIEIVIEQVKELIKNTPYKNSPIIPTSSQSKTGIEKIKIILIEQAKEIPERSVDYFRMPIDRVFTIKGAGTIVTGSVLSGTLRKSDSVEIGPLKGSKRVRAIEAYGRGVDNVEAGMRAALNIPSLSISDVERGMLLNAVSAISCHQQFLAKIFWVDKDCRTYAKGQLELAIFSGHFSCRINEITNKNETSIVFLNLNKKVPLRAEDRGILIQPGLRMVTGAIQIILPIGDFPFPDFRTAKRKAKELEIDSNPLYIIFTLLQRRLFSKKDIAEALGIMKETASEIIDYETHHKAIEKWGGDFYSNLKTKEIWYEEIKAYIDAKISEKNILGYVPLEDILSYFRKSIPDSAVEEIISDIASAGNWEKREGKLYLKNRDIDSKAMNSLRQLKLLIESEPIMVYSTKEINSMISHNKPADIIKRAMDEGWLIKLSEDLFIAKVHVEKIITVGTDTLRQKSIFAVPDFKNLFKLTRKSAIPILEYLDKLGWTRRSGDGRQWL